MCNDYKTAEFINVQYQNMLKVFVIGQTFICG